MKKIILVFSVLYGVYATAGAQFEIPIELLDLDNQGRNQFIKNALGHIGVATGTYRHFRSVIIGGESTVQDAEKGAYMAYFVEMQTSRGTYHCEQKIALGVFVRTRPDLVDANPVSCTLR